MKLLIALGLALLLAGCSPSAARSERSAGSRVIHTVTIQGLAFQPANLTVARGTRITWINEDNVEHTVTSGRPGKDAIPGVSKGTASVPTGVFDHPLSRNDASFSFSFEKPGAFTYFCRIHSSMRGVVVVR